MGEMVEFESNGSTGPGYLAVPPSGSGPGVVVIQEWWGLIDQIKSVADRLAAEGFVALVPDLFRGTTASLQEPDEAGKLMMAMDMDRAARDLTGAVAYLQGLDSVGGDGVGCVGFCMGGGLALYLASIDPSVVATVIYYGAIPWEQVKPDITSVRGAVLMHFAENDDWASPAVGRDLADRLRAAGVDATLYIYPGTTHAFFNDDRPEVYDAAAAEQCWPRTLEFLRAQLG